jgi:GntR family transcriptional regulator, transcriptional repressor for pyruvate dehydrogenase complex
MTGLASDGLSDAMGGARQRMFREIESLVIEGSWPPGHKLPSERALVDQYRLSRPLVREVLRGLEERGYIDVVPARGSYVRGASASDAAGPLRSLYQRSGVTARHLVVARKMLECEAAELAALSEDVEAKQNIAIILAANESARELSVRADLDVAFHEAVVRACGNPVLRIMFGSIRPLVRGLIVRSLTDRDVRQAGEPLHNKICDAIQAGDAGAARHAMDQHLSIALSFYGDDLDDPLSTVLRRRASESAVADLDAILSDLDALL